MIEDKSDKSDDFDEKGDFTDRFRFNRTDLDDRQIKPEFSLKHAMKDFKEQMMTKVLHESRLHNQQLVFEGSIKIEQNLRMQANCK